MNYCIVENGVITNIITCENDKIAAEFLAVASYDGAQIGNAYTPQSPLPIPEPEPPTPAQLREEAYNTKAIISWDGDMLTVTEASQKWQYYAAEGNTAKTDELTALIAAAKQAIREQYPDEEG